MILSKTLRRAYHDCLQQPRPYHTNQYEFDVSNSQPDVVIYFIHGLGGAPGQANLVIPSIQRVLSVPFYIESMHIPELDVSLPFIKRYRAGVTEKIRQKILDDLNRLIEKFPQRKIVVTVSSHGMYDFIYAYQQMNRQLRERIVVIWLACASDDYHEVEKKNRGVLSLLYGLTGYKEQGHKWTFGINHNRLSFINPEISTSFHYRCKKNKSHTFFKKDIEVRFKRLGVQWTDPTSISFIQEYLTKQLHGYQPINDIQCYVLAALQDGYWHDSSASNIRNTVAKYISTSNHTIHYADTSHLWCVTPPFVEPFLANFFQRELAQL